MKKETRFRRTEDGEPQETEGIKYQLPEGDEFPEEESDSRAEYMTGNASKNQNQNPRNYGRINHFSPF